MMAAKSNLKQIAEKSGVSVATVSQILNNRSQNYSSEETKHRVRRVAKELGYQPNFGYKLMQGQKTQTVAILNSMPEMKFEEYVLKLIMLLIVKFDRLGYSAYCNTFTEDPAKNLETVRTLINRGVEHFVFLGCPFGHAEITAELEKRDLPVIASTDSFKRYIKKDSLGGAHALFSHHIKQVGENFKLICQKKEITKTNDRISALLKIFPQFTEKEMIGRFVFLSDDIDFDVADYTQEAYAVAGKATAKLLEAHPDIKAIFYINDTLAVGGGRYILGSGKEEFRKILLTGFNNNENILRNFPLPISSVSFDMLELSELLIQNVLHHKPCRLEMPPTLHIRETCEQQVFPQWTERTVKIKPQS